MRFIAAVLATTLVGSAAQVKEPRLGVSGDRFTVNGTPRFLVLVSYFDAMDATPATLRSDFAFLRAHGIDGVRIFPNWWDCDAPTTCHRPSPRTLLDASGKLRPGRLDRLQEVLTIAASHGLIVDLSFTRETVPGLRYEGYEAGLVATVAALEGRHAHTLVDLQNEVEINSLGRSKDGVADVVHLAGAVTGADPERLLVASVSGDVGRAQRFGRATRKSLDAVAYHDPRRANWWSRVPAVVRQLKDGETRPIYLQEPTAFQRAGARADDDAAALHFVSAVRAARDAGAAAWVFHTRKGFDLSQRSFQDQLEDGERSLLLGGRESFLKIN
jgi:hypothetical protein